MKSRPVGLDTRLAMVDRDVFKTLDLALRIGEMLLSSGAGAADVTATMLAVTRALGLRGVVADVTFTALALHHQVSLDEPGSVQTRRVTHREIDYEDLTLVDHLVRDVVDGNLDRDEARAALARIVSSGHRRPRWAVNLGWGAVGAGTALLLGGGAVITLVAFAAAVCIDRIQRAMTVRRMPVFYQQVAGGLFATLLASAIAAAGLDIDPSLVVTASIVMLLAGIGFVGATQDALSGFPLTAGARSLEAMLATAGIIAGVTGGFDLADALGVDLGRLDPGAYDLANPALLTLGGAVVSAAFAFSSYAPLRTLVPVALVGSLASMVYSLAVNLHVGPAWSTAFAAVAVGVISYTVAGTIRVPPLVVVMCGVVPLLPGLAIYRGLAQLALGQGGTLSLVGAAATAIALASGAILGQYLAQPLKREARRLETRLSGPRLVGPLRSRTHRR